MKDPLGNVYFTSINVGTRLFRGFKRNLRRWSSI